MEQLGKYRIITELGKGGFATVYRAEDTTLGREVALKILDPLLMRDTTWVDRFRREARTVATLDHPRIVPIYEIAEADDRLFIAMKLIDGPSLDKALAERGPLPWDETERITREIAAALSYAHDQQLLHRDLKPGNVLLHPERGALLTDFGFARMVSESSMSVSLSGGIVGTPHYIAPEIWHNKPATPATDLYALGCVLYEMVLGRKAFPGDTSPAIMTAHLLQPLELPAAWPEGVPTGLSDVLQTALAREPEARFGQVAAFVAALDALAVDPLAEPYTALKAAVADARWDEALRLAEDIRAQAPDYRDVEALLLQAQSRQDRAQREQLATQWKTQAHAALEAGQVEVARAAAERWVQLSPEDEEAEALLAQVEKSTTSEVHETPPTAATPSPASATEKSGEASASVRREPSPTQKGFPAWGWALGLLALVALGLGVLGGRAPEEPTAVPTPTSVEPEALVVGDTRIRESDGMTMVYVPAGEFEMGSTDGNDDEQPVHTVALDAFWLDQTEISVAQFRQFVTATDHETTAEEGGGSAEADHPVVHVSWHDAAAYCAWVGGRLPTEAEWEVAARGPESLIYPWGNVFDGTRLNYCDQSCSLDWADEHVDDGYEFTAPVGSYPGGASWVGALDLSGNVWEWVADWYGENYYAQSPQENPTGPASGDFRVLRGGAWFSNVRGRAWCGSLLGRSYRYERLLRVPVRRGRGPRGLAHCPLSYDPLSWGSGGLGASPPDARISRSYEER